MLDKLETVIHEPVGAVESVIIWMHGLGADANDFASLVPELGLKNTRFIFPNAPIRPVTVNGGMSMRSWYDFLTFEFSKGEDVGELMVSVKQIGELIQQQIAEGISLSNIIVGGFSQGGAVALLVPGLLDLQGRLGGVVAWSTYLPEQCAVLWDKYPPVFMAHGTYDQVIPIAVGQKSKDSLIAHTVSLEWHEYPMEHQVCQQQFVDLKKWITRRQ